MESLRRRRTGIILLSLGYFLCLLAVGAAVFLNDAGPVTAYGLIAFCAAVYLLLVRPAIRRYTGAVREAVLEHVVCQDLEGFCYSRKEGISPQVVRDSGLMADNSGKAFASREHITGHKGGMEVELAGFRKRTAFELSSCMAEGISYSVHTSYFRYVMPSRLYSYSSSGSPLARVISTDSPA